MAKNFSVFVQIGAKIDSTFAGAFGQAENRISRFSRAVSRSAHELRSAAREIGAAAREASKLAAAGAGFHGSIQAAGRAARAGAELQGARVDMQKAGIGKPEISELWDQSLKLAIQYKNVTQAGLLELSKEIRSVMTDPHEVLAVMPSIAAAKSLLDARDSSGQASHGLNMLVKGAEVIGAAQSPERLIKLVDGYVKAMQVMGKTITPESIYEFDKYSKLGGARLSDRFLLTTAQSLGQELGGSTAGLGVGGLYKQISGGMQNLHTAAQEFARVGLIDPANLDRTKTGEIKGVRKGVLHAVKGDDKAATDPDRWVYEDMLPAIEAAGIRSVGDQLAWVRKAFPNGNVADVIGKMIVQRNAFAAHAKQYDAATGLAGTSLNRDDPTAALGGLTKSLETFSGVLTSPVMQDAGHALDAMAGWIGTVSTRLEAFNKEHPLLAKAEAPVAGGVALAGAAGAAGGAWKLLGGGFGLKGSAVALNESAAALTAAAGRLGVSNATQGAAATAPGKLPAFVGGLGALGATAAIGYVLAEYGDARKSVNGTGGRPADGLKLNPSDELPGLAGSADRPSWVGPSALRMAGRSSARLAIGASGLSAFGLGGALSPEAVEAASKNTAAKAFMDGLRAGMERAAPLNPSDELPGLSSLADDLKAKGKEAGSSAAESIGAALEAKTGEIVGKAKSVFGSVAAVFSAGIDIPVRAVPGSSASSSAPALAGARAKGGPVAAGSPYLVGERGPEIFVPNGSGRIETNGVLNSLSRAGGRATDAGGLKVGVDASAVEEAGKTAQRAGEQLHASLDATRKPFVDTSSIDEAITKAERLKAILAGGAGSINLGGEGSGSGAASAGRALPGGAAARAGAASGGTRTGFVSSDRAAAGPGTGAGGSYYEAIMRAEGTAGKDPYNVVLGNGRYGLPDKPLTDMTLAEAYAFGRKVRARHGSSSAIGAFQIVGRTMKDAMRGTGLGEGDKFSPENQRTMADWIRRKQGFGAWEGFKRHRGELANARAALRSPAEPATKGEPVALAGARAMGGPVNRGLSYLVGERGPEIFSPGASGQITTNGTLNRLAELGSRTVAAEDGGTSPDVAPSAGLVAKLRPQGGNVSTRGDTNYSPSFAIHGASDIQHVRRQVESHFFDLVSRHENDQRGLLSD